MGALRDGRQGDRARRVAGTVALALGVACVAGALMLLMWAWQREYSTAATLAAEREALVAHIEAERAAGGGGVATDEDRVSMRDMPTWAAVDGALAGTAYAGMLEVMDEGLSVPVVAELDAGRLGEVACRASGSAYAGNLVIYVGAESDAGRVLAALPAGTEVQVTTVEGVTFLYGVAGVADAGDAAGAARGGRGSRGGLELVLVDDEAEPVTVVSCLAVR